MLRRDKSKYDSNLMIPLCQGEIIPYLLYSCTEIHTCDQIVYQ